MWVLSMTWMRVIQIPVTIVLRVHVRKKLVESNSDLLDGLGVLKRHK